MAMLGSVQGVSSQHDNVLQGFTHDCWFKSNLLRDSNIVLINLLTSLAVCGVIGHNKFKNLSLSVRFLKLGINEEIFPKRQFLSILNLGHRIKK